MEADTHNSNSSNNPNSSNTLNILNTQTSVNTLIKHLQDPALYPHSVKYFQVIETHISWILLTGLFAYKIKKPVHYSFVDFSSLEKRKWYCEEELRLNKRLSGFLYLGLVAITGTMTNPELNGSGTVIEYALKMEEFRQDQLWSVLVTTQEISLSLIEKLAHKISEFHAKTETAALKSRYGTLESIWAPMVENFQFCKTHTRSKALLKKLENIETFSLQHYDALKPFFELRKQTSYIKDCHGDLHLGNIVLLHHLPIVFDCIEFNPDFRNIDTINEIAFLTMDLKQNKSPILAMTFLNYYLNFTADYAGLRLLVFYEVYRAMIRAKVALLRKQKTSRNLFENYIKLSEALIKKFYHKTAAVIITYGVSGVGKTTISGLLALSLEAIHIRSDVERKRLFGIQAGMQHSMEDLYSKEVSEKTYVRLMEICHLILQSGYPVIVDATFLKQEYREQFQLLAKQYSLPFIILQFEAEIPTLQKRIFERLSLGNDISDATSDTLEQQLKERDSLLSSEKPYTILVNSEKKVKIASLAKTITKKISRFKL